MPVDREIDKIPLRFDLSVKISFTDKFVLCIAPNFAPRERGRWIRIVSPVAAMLPPLQYVFLRKIIFKKTTEEKSYRTS